jgi:hypothetical protein
MKDKRRGKRDITDITPEEKILEPDLNIPNWRTDDPSPDLAEYEHIGAKTVTSGVRNS